jgi:hypothetical protein
MAIIVCSECGNDVSDLADSCPHCGIPTRFQQQSFAETRYVAPEYTKKKRKSSFLRFVVGVFSVIVIIAAANSVFSSQSKSPSSTPKATPTSTTNTPVTDWKVFDERTWADYKALYKSHNALMKVIIAYSDGHISKMDYYTRLNEYNTWFFNAGRHAKYGTTEEEKKYLSWFESTALADSAGIRALIKHLDSGNVSDMSTANTEIQNAKTALTTIAYNRIALLEKTGISRDAATTKVENDLLELDAE